MANPEHLAMLQRGVPEWNEWKQMNPEATPDLSSVNLSGTNLQQADLVNCDLHDVDLSRADLRGAKVYSSELTEAKLNAAILIGANFMGAKLDRSDLELANLSWANLGRASLDGAVLRETNLILTNFRGAALRGADFSGAIATFTDFGDLDLSLTVGLEELSHAGPSTVGIDTIYKSKGKIPEVFLRGCGVPDDMIGYIKSIAGAIQYYTCFISCSTKDQAFADRLYADLQAKGVRCWFAPHDIMGGRKIHEQIDEAIRVHDKLLLILSEHSMASDWVGTEIANAREREAREKKQMLFPITIAPFDRVQKWELFDADRGKDSAREIREYYIPDFSGWEKDHGAYVREFEKLVAALKAGASG